MKKLLATDIFSGGDFDFMEWYLNHSLYLADLSQFPGIYNGQTNTRIPRSPGSSTSVRIYFHIIRQFIIDNMSDPHNINTARSYICCDEQLQGLFPELTHHLIPLLLCQITM